MALRFHALSEALHVRRQMPQVDVIAGAAATWDMNGMKHSWQWRLVAYVLPASSPASPRPEADHGDRPATAS